MEVKEVIAKMKELGIARVKFEFTCGGDCMNDTDIIYYNSKDEVVDNTELDGYFDDKVYDNVDFYVNSDGHYCGEAGHVDIEINEEGDDFDYVKNSEEEWSESVDTEVEVELTDKEVEFVKSNIADINGGYDETTNVNFSRDFIMSDEDEETLKSVIAKVDKAIENCEPNYNGEPQDWYNFSTEDLSIVDNVLKVQGYFYEYIYKSGE